MSKLNRPAMEIIEGEMFIFGEKLPRHPEFPWLFSATALHKFCEEAIKLRAEQNGKDPEKFYKAKRPAEWIRFNITNNEERIEQYAKHTRTRIKKYGPNLGFAERKSDARFLASQIDSLTDLQVVCVTAKGNSSKLLQGSYLCQLAIVKYIETFSEKFRATVQNSFISMANGEVETVVPDVEKNARKARGTPERKEHKEQNYRLTKACGDKHLLPIHPQKGINLATLGTTAKKFKEATAISEPLNDNLPVGLVAVRAVATELTAKSLEDSPAATISPKQGVKIGFHSGLIAKRVMQDRKTRDTILRETLAADPEAMANAIKYGLLP